MPPATTCGISTGFPVLSPTLGKVAHVLLTRSPLATSLSCERKALARLACVRHAASVNPEPGSNSPFDQSQTLCLIARTLGHSALSLVDSKRLSHSSVGKVRNPPSSTTLGPQQPNVPEVSRAPLPRARKAFWR